MNRRTFILSSASLLVAPAVVEADASYLNSLIPTKKTVDEIQALYPFASALKLKMACWDDYLNDDQANNDPNQCFVHVSPTWRVI